MTQPDPPAQPPGEGQQDPVGEGGHPLADKAQAALGGEPASGPEPWQGWLRRAERYALGRAGQLPIPAWLRPTRGERRWPITVTIASAIVLEILLPPRLTGLPAWLMPGLELLLLLGVTVADPMRVERDSTVMRAATIVLTILLTAANAVSAVLLIREIVNGKASGAAVPLLASGASIWATNVIAFALWYWEFDRGGPIRRTSGSVHFPDLMFPQMASPQLASPDWEPHFVDYLYLSFTNATAFSPTDVMPLARWAKFTMLVQSAVSLAIGALVIARAVNVLR